MDESSAIEDRIRANHDAQVFVALFIEYVPDTLNTWLSKQLSKEDGSFDQAIEMVERNLKDTIEFINSKGNATF